MEPASSNRLNELLASMSTDSTLNIIKTVVAPKQKELSEKRAKKSEYTGKKPANILEAVKDVANELGGDTKQTESELLLKLLKKSGEGDDIKLR